MSIRKMQSDHADEINALKAKHKKELEELKSSMN